MSKTLNIIKNKTKEIKRKLSNTTKKASDKYNDVVDRFEKNSKEATKAKELRKDPKSKVTKKRHIFTDEKTVKDSEGNKATYKKLAKKRTAALAGAGYGAVKGIEALMDDED